jgi:hypothetical protein
MPRCSHRAAPWGAVAALQSCNASAMPRHSRTRRCDPRLTTLAAARPPRTLGGPTAAGTIPGGRRFLGERCAEEAAPAAAQTNDPGAASPAAEQLSLARRTTPGPSGPGVVAIFNRGWSGGRRLLARLHALEAGIARALERRSGRALERWSGRGRERRSGWARRRCRRVARREGRNHCERKQKSFRHGCFLR